MHMWLAAGVGLVGGIGLGYLFFYATQGRKSEESKAAELQAELEQYREAVNGHFSRTSDLFQGVTKQYRELYDHLAQGAQSLCDPIPATPELGLSENDLLAHQRSNGAGETKDVEKPRAETV